MTIAYYFSCFPQISTTFLQREVRALTSLGVKPVLISNRPPSAGGYHPTDQDLFEQTFYLHPVRPGLYLKSNLKRMIQSPRRYFKGLGLAFSLKDKRFPGMIFKNLARFAGAAVLAEHLEKRKISHIHVHFAFGAAGVAIFLAAISRISYSISIHGSDVLLPNPLTEEKLKRADFIISNCRFHITNLTARYPSLSKKQFYPVYLGIDMRSPFLSKTTDIDMGKPLRILNIGRLEAVKGQDILIRSCALLHDKGVEFQCKIVGDGSKYQQLAALIDQLTLNDKVLLLGTCYESDVADLLDWAHVMVLSSLSEGTPMTIIESMMKGRPVVAPRITAIPEMVVDGKTGFLFEKANPQDLADKLTVLSKQPKLRIEMGKQGRKRSEIMFDLEKNAGKLKDIFKKNTALNNREND